jgi:IS5 family transposase
MGHGMRPRKQDSKSEGDLFRASLRQVIDMGHTLVKLADKIDWAFFDERFLDSYAETGRPGIPTRLMVGVHLLKYMVDLSDDGICDRWVRDPYFQYFCGEAFFQHRLPMDRSSMTRWRERIGPDALRAEDMKQITVDTTVQGNHFSDRRQTDVAGSGKAGGSGQRIGRLPPPKLCPGG